MKIGFDITPLCVPQSGVGTYTLNLLEHLQQQSRNTVVPLAHRPPIVTRNGMPPAVIPAIRSNKTVWMQLLLPFQLKSLDLEIGHFTNSVAPLISPIQTVVTLHDMTLWLYPQHHYRRRLLAMKPFIPLAIRRASAVVTVSNSAKADIVRLLSVPAEKVHVIYEAADPAFRPLPRDIADSLIGAYTPSAPYILYVGTLEPRKNLKRLVEAFAGLISAAGAPHHLILAGQRGWKEASLFAAIERAGLRERVHVLNHLPVEALVALYNRADLLAFPSLYEGFGLPIVEAMACGTPVLTSRRGSLAEVAGNAAHYVDPTDVESIREGLRQLIDDGEYRRELRRAGLARAADFSWENAAAETLGVYEKVVKGLPAPRATPSIVNDHSRR